MLALCKNLWCRVTGTLHRGESRVLEEGGGHILSELSVHDITGDIKCIIAVHGDFNACQSLETCSTEFFLQFDCCEDKLLFKARVVM